jgi:hypothetical protein
MRSYFQFLLCVAGLCAAAQAQTPMITSLSPSSVAAGSAQFTLKVLGANFPALAGCYVTWSDSVRSNTILTTTWISTMEVDAPVPAGYVAVVETASVGVSCGLVQSNSVAFAVTGSTSTVTINTGATLPQGTTGAFYNISLAASGGAQPYLWSPITALPPGLTLSQGGVLSGTPTTASQYAFMILVSDSSSPQLTAQQTFSLIISAPGGTLTISTSSLPAAMAGQPYTTPLTAAGGTPPYTWVGTSLPSWLTLTRATGLLGGTPPAVGTYMITVQVSDSASHTSSKSFSLSVTMSSTSLSITTSSPLPAGVVGVAYPSTTLAVSGGVGPYTWVIFSGNLPPGLNLDQDAGTITGTPQTAGTYAFTVQVADSTGLDATADFSLTVTATSVTPLTISTSSLPGAASGQPYSATLTASGGTTPYTWTATSLPSWLTLAAATGALSGTPPAGGTFTITVQVTDSSAPTARTVSRSFTLVVTSVSISITTASPLPAGMVGAAYPSTTLAATGGTAPYTWVILSGNTDGLSLDPTGIISGTPQTAGTFNFTVQVTDNAGQTGSKAFALTISGPSLTITAVGASTGTVGVAFSQSYTVVGGTAPYTWKACSSVTGTTCVPATTATVPGLTFNANTSPVTLLGTPTQQGSFTITLQATDANQATGTRTFTITVAPGPLRITTSGQLPAGTLGTAYTLQMAAAGGTPPYTWSATGLPAGLAISSSGLITGTVGTAGALTLVVMVTDSAQPPATARSNFQINVTPQALPAITISGLPATAGPLMQYSVTVAIASAYPVDITGTAVLSSSPSDSGPTDGSIQFSGGGKSASFKVNAGTTSTTLAIQTGSVAGTVTLTLSQLSAGGTDVTPTPAPSARTQMAGAAPVITAASVSRSGSTLTVQITGYATSREVTQAQFTFTAATGQTLQTGASQLTVSLSSLFSAYFQNSQYASTGSQFVFSQPFTIQGDINSVIPTNVTLTNRVGSTTSAVH